MCRKTILIATHMCNVSEEKDECPQQQLATDRESGYSFATNVKEEEEAVTGRKRQSADRTLLRLSKVSK